MAPAPPLRTKIVATVGPACDDLEVLARMFRAGVTTARINLAHGTSPDHTRLVRRVRAAAHRAGRPVAILMDLAGPKIRVGELVGGRAQLEAGRGVRLTSAPGPGSARSIPITEPAVLADIRRGDPVFLADGTLELRAMRTEPGKVECEVVTGGLLLPGKGVNLPHTRLSLPFLTQKDRHDLRHALRLGVDVLALSFVRSARDLASLRRLIGRRPAFLVAKVERPEAVRHLADIVAAADGVMVARGDLGVEMRIEEVPLIQKEIIRLANQQAKPVITATQMLKSMVDSPRPTRAEAGDVANAILDGTDAVMLSEETAMGHHPLRSVETMARIARLVEATLDPHAFAQRAQAPAFVAGAVSDAAVHVARDVRARAIVTPTSRGATARYVARLRPEVPVLALSHRLATVHALCLTWGVEPIHVPDLGPFESVLRFTRRLLRERGWVRRGNRFVLTSGFPAGKASNLMTVQEVDDE